MFNIRCQVKTVWDLDSDSDAGLQIGLSTVQPSMNYLDKWTNYMALVQLSTLEPLLPPEMPLGFWGSCVWCRCDGRSVGTPCPAGKVAVVKSPARREIYWDPQESVWWWYCLDCDIRQLYWKLWNSMFLQENNRALSHRILYLHYSFTMKKKIQLRL